MQKQRILIVDDEADLREIFKDGLEAAGFEVFEASSGNEAIQFIKSNQVDSVISDIRMPDGSGLDFLDYIKNICSEELLVFLMTGFSDIDPEEAYNRGASALFRKPVNPKTVIESLKQVQRLKGQAGFLRPPRYRVSMPLTLLNLSKPNSKAYPSQTINISRGGIYCSSEDSLINLNDRIEFKIQYEESKNKLISGQLSVKRIDFPTRKNPKLCFGAQIIKLDPQSEQGFKELLSQLEDEVIPLGK